MSSVFFSEHLPSLKQVFSSINPKAKKALVFCDKRFQNQSILKKWKSNKNLKFYFLSSGEKSKSLERLPSHIKKIISLDKDFDKSSLCFISIGGGSLIDLTGFLSSIYKRGLSVVHFPSTWLSALDSAYGGKTAINFQNVKNILGSYHLPKAVFVVYDLLKQNPKKLREEAFGELLKISFIEGGELYKKIKKQKGEINIKNFIKPAIQAKIKIVTKDPFETKGIRKKLNLGHTTGHIFESLYTLPHGIAVGQGLLFSLNWSFHKNFISKNHFTEMKALIPKKRKTKKIPLHLFKKHLKQDKKHKANYKIDFVFIKKPGNVFIQPVTETDLLNEAKRQNII